MGFNEYCKELPVPCMAGDVIMTSGSSIVALIQLN